MKIVGMFFFLLFIFISALPANYVCGRGYYRDADSSFVIPKSVKNLDDVIVVSDKHNVFYRRIYAYCDDPLAQSVLSHENEEDLPLHVYRDLNESYSLRNDYLGMRGKYEW